MISEGGSGSFWTRLKKPVPEHALPVGVEAVPGPKGLRLKGSPEPLIEAVESLRFLGKCPVGHQIAIGPWRLVVSDRVPRRFRPRVVSMPAHAWQVAPSVLRDAVLGDYGDLPFDFGDVQYLKPVQNPDIGVELV